MNATTTGNVNPHSGSKLDRVKDIANEYMGRDLDALQSYWRGKALAFVRAGAERNPQIKDFLRELVEVQRDDVHDELLGRKCGFAPYHDKKLPAEVERILTQS
ncbi:hypothetical protein M409DRAFT_29482 [Zasmidium cellare ATCC 36951]|uniref:Uncharacterized protein n=1 Tax=Zasmidium cellare ATCC 36951 TaxID=1080233 RepID=A0A6A6C1J7_ZASCE|nr:uncharacterized protein M409DRAFT_29482 [Zasmidium cellare ATCC 36951]KAF2160030.1 hypothetical protein M409DRAFT_29482 [Zasmidium cellare ATCC 36951]